MNGIGPISVKRYPDVFDWKQLAYRLVLDHFHLRIFGLFAAWAGSARINPMIAIKANRYFDFIVYPPVIGLIGYYWNEEKHTHLNIS